MKELDFEVVQLGGLPVAVTNRASSAVAMIAAAIGRRGSDLPPLYVTSANGEVMSSCAKDPAVKALFTAADAIHADGMPMVWASRILCRSPLPERVATTDLFHDVASRAVPTGATFYMLGATPDALAKAARNVRRLHPGLRLIGTHHGHFAPSDEARIVREIAGLKPDILWVAMGVPREQAFVLRNRDALAGVGLVKTSGGLFDFLSGDRKRAPDWMQAAGLEWLFRLSLEPRRLLRRYALTNPHALFLLATRSA